MTSSTATGGVRSLLRLEGLAVLAASVLVFSHLGGNWWVFAVLFLVPDISMLGYLKGPRVGAVAYNMGHSTLGPIALGAMGLTIAPQVLPYAVIWIAHIGFDRALGYGLKYAGGFGVTHLGLLGKARKAVQPATN